MNMVAQITAIRDGIGEIFRFFSREAAIEWANMHYREYDQIDVKFLRAKDIRQGR